MKNNFIDTLDLPNQFSDNKILSNSFILFGKLHQIKWKNNKFDWCSIKTIISKKEEEIFEKIGTFKDESELLDLRNLILTKI